MTAPPSSCLQITAPWTHGSAITSAMVALFLGSIVNMRDMICRLSLGSKRIRRHGPLITSAFLSGAGAAAVVPLLFAVDSPFGAGEVSGIGFGVGTASLEGVPKSVVDFDGAGVSDNLFMSVPGDGGEAKSL